MWVVEKTGFSSINCARQKEQIALVVIVNLGERGFFLETEKDHKDYYEELNSDYPGRPQNFHTAEDSNNPWKNYMEVKQDRHIVENR